MITGFVTKGNIWPNLSEASAVGVGSAVGGWPDMTAEAETFVVSGSTLAVSPGSLRKGIANGTHERFGRLAV